MGIFDKYLKERDPEKDHAKLSASGSERWLGCPGSVKLSEGIAETESEASIRGTNTHTLIQFMLENGDWKDLLHTKEGVRFRVMIGYDSAMLKNARYAVDFVWQEYVRMKKTAPVQLFAEKKVELPGVGFGTSDVILYQPFGTFHVMDYKNGVKAVEPENNTQGLYYAVAGAELFNWEFSEVKITIIQPNAANKRGHIRTWVTDEKELDRARVLFNKGAALTRKKKAPLVKNDSWCWFCPARQICPLQREDKTKKLMERFGI